MNWINIALTFAFAAGSAAAQPFEDLIPIWEPPLVLIPVHCECPPAPKLNASKSSPLSQPRNIVLRWNDAALDAIRAERTPPPVAARHLAVLHVAIFDAVNAVERTHEPFAIRSTPPRSTAADVAAAIAAHRVLSAIFPRQTATFDALRDSMLITSPISTAKTNGMSLGQTIAERVLDWRAKDMDPRRVSYKSQSAPGRWKPTPPDYRPALLPDWATIPGFVIDDPQAFRPDGPPSPSSEEFVAAFHQVKDLGGLRSRSRTPEQTEIAWFWADGNGTVTPPGHWNRIARGIAIERRLTLAENARLFALLNVALADAAICCWDCKFKFDLWRPVTAIREASSQHNVALTADPTWTPLLATPPFPAYTSGHSTFSAAAAAALSAYFGSDTIAFTTTSDDLPGVSRSFRSFTEAAREAGMSRIYGGIHWDFDNRDGLELGKRVGEYVARGYFRKRDEGR